MTACLKWLRAALNVVEKAGEFPGLWDGLTFWQEQLILQCQELQAQPAWKVNQALQDYCIMCLEVCEDLWDLSSWSNDCASHWQTHLVQAELIFRSAEDELSDSAFNCGIYA
jgi:hypothetical protein